MKIYNFFLILAITSILLGCGNWPTIHQKALYSDTLPNPMAQIYRPGLRAYIINADATSSGNTVALDQEFLNTLIKDMDRMRTFSTILQGQPDTDSKNFVTLTIRASEAEDWHHGANAFKGILIGLTMFVLTPVLRMDYDFEQEISIQAHRWDGQVKNYTAKGSGSNSFTSDGTQGALLLRNQIVEANRNSLINQLVQDAAFFEVKS